MKKIIVSAVLLGLSFQSYAQKVIYQAKLKAENVPKVLVSAVEEDFPEYSIVEYDAIPIEYIDEEVYLNPDINSLSDYDTFEITLTGKKGELLATYDSNGNLLQITEKLKDITPPLAVRKAIAKEFPEWSLVKDHYSLVRYTNSKKKERYRMVLENHGKKITVHTDARGHILNHHKRT
ncbi:hypothetical protein HPE56_03395 [Maribacter sp. ANRC-HE7]|uniref:Beta-lactamase-inhibitor-like, PepSY-like n=1 Tax=Maribacter aquimaris TaxID=2737171 RepID=A0ABR7UWE8_9FLAO|nr:hypothetical protein [Maribacter aquimaris]MBD0776829.1 hypothetical protein [Maribacter aquimaris]